MAIFIENDEIVPKYPKIQTVYKRDPDNNYRTLLIGEYSLPEIEYLAHNEWLWTEKIDGTNIRVYWDGVRVWLGGRTERSQIPPFLVNSLEELFPTEKFRQIYPDTEMVLYGEGYGNKIQKVGNSYIKDDTNFILFDVLIGGYWLEREDIEDVAHQLEINFVPIRGRGSINDAIEMVRNGFSSWTSHDHDLIAEGLIMFPSEQLFNRHGSRIITKIKYKDFE